MRYVLTRSEIIQACADYIHKQHPDINGIVHVEAIITMDNSTNDLTIEVDITPSKAAP